MTMVLLGFGCRWLEVDTPGAPAAFIPGEPYLLPRRRDALTAVAVAQRGRVRMLRSKIPATGAMTAAASPPPSHSFSGNQTGSYGSGNGPRDPRSTYRDTSITVSALAETTKPSANGRRLADVIRASPVSRASTASARNKIPSLTGAWASA